MMMKKNPSFKITIIISVLLHILVLGFLFFHISKPQKITNNSVNIIKAVVVNESVNHPQKNQTEPREKKSPPEKPMIVAEKIENIEQKTLRQHVIPQEKTDKKVDTLKIAKKISPREEENVLDTPDLSQKEIEKQNKLQMEENLKAQKMAQEKILQEKKELEKQKKLAEKQKKAALVKKRKEEEAKKLQKELEKEKQQVAEMQQAKEDDEEDNSQTPSEAEDKPETTELQKNITPEHEESTAAKTEAAEGEIDKYKQKIIQSISQKWLMPTDLDEKLSCQLLVHLGPGGIVVSVDVLKESGDETLDRSARTAVLKASPLPVPDAAELFDKFRSLRLTFRPQGVVAN